VNQELQEVRSQLGVEQEKAALLESEVKQLEVRGEPHYGSVLGNILPLQIRAVFNRGCFSYLRRILYSFAH